MPETKIKRENLVINIVCNIVVPTFVLSKLSGDHWLGPVGGLVVALAFPLGYGIYDFARRRRMNFISILGIVSVLLTGGLGLLKLDGFWFAVKDGALPALIGVAVLASMRSKQPVVLELIYNPQVIDVERVDAALAERGTQNDFSRLIQKASYLIAFAMLVSGVLNYSFARAIIRSPAGTEAFNQELAKMHWVSLLGLSIPSMAMMLYALWQVLKGLQGLTGLTLDEILRQTDEKKEPAPK